LVCILDDATAGIAIEDESGKVDLNNATPQLLAATLTGFGLSGDTAAVVNGILAFRGPADKMASAADESAFSKSSAKGAPFETALELDQVEGMTPELFRALLPFVTVHSKRPGVNVQAAAPALFAALAGYPIEDVQALLKKPFPNRLDRRNLRHLSEFLSYQQGTGGDTFAIHVEVVLRNGQAGVRDTIVDLNASPQNNFRISEIRRLSPRRWNDLNTPHDPSVLKPCW
jgi:general secretion pathway protein K